MLAQTSKLRFEYRNPKGSVPSYCLQVARWDIVLTIRLFLIAATETYGPDGTTDTEAIENHHSGTKERWFEWVG